MPAAGRRRERGRRARQHHGCCWCASGDRSARRRQSRSRLRRTGRRRQDDDRGGRGRAGGAAGQADAGLHDRSGAAAGGRARHGRARRRAASCCRPRRAARSAWTIRGRARAAARGAHRHRARRSRGSCSRPVADPEMRRRIFDNTIYRQITTMLTGSQEYAATLALHDFVSEREVRSGRPGHAADGQRARLPGGARAHRRRGVEPGADLVRAPARRGEAVLVSAAAFGRRAAGAPDGEAGRQPVPRRRGRLPRSTSRTCWAASWRARRPSTSCCAVRTSAFLLVLVPEVAADRRGAVLPRAAARGGHRAGRIRREPGPPAARAWTRRARSRRRCAPSRRRRRSPAATRRRRGGAAAPRSRTRSRRWRRRSGASSARLGARAPGVRITEVPLLDHDVDNLAELRVVGEHLARPA